MAAAEEIGRDGMVLLETIWSEEASPYLRSLPAVETLRRCWIAQFCQTMQSCAGVNLPPAPARIDSPYDIEDCRRLTFRM